MDASANWRRPEGDRVTAFATVMKVLPPILAEEKTLLHTEQA